MSNRKESLISLTTKEVAQLLADVIRYTPENVPFPVVMLCGPTGGGKTTFIQDFGRAMERPVVVCELAGMEPPDIVGLPVEKDGVCVFAKPWWFNSLEDSNKNRTDFNPEWISYLKSLIKDIPENKLPDRILFMDELNRAHPDTQNPVMNILLECRHQGEYMRHRTLIVGAGNITTEGEDYNVNEFDTAVRDRVRMINYKPTIREWVEFAGERINPQIISYVEKNTNLIRNFSSKGILSLRTMFKLGEVLKDFPVHEDPTRTKAIIGSFVPVNLIENIYNELVSSTEQVKPEDILAHYSNEKKDVRKNVLNIINKKRIDLINVILNNLYSEVLKKKNVTEKLTNNLLLFIKDLPKPLAFSFVCRFRDLAMTPARGEEKRKVDFAAKLLNKIVSTDEYVLQLATLDKLDT